jgi:folylpolyglutamate synthase/dihydropteroate synthase
MGFFRIRMSNLPATLPEWLALLEQRHPKEIDMGLERVSRA